MRINVLLVGLGHFCKRIYLPTVFSLREKYDIGNIVGLDKKGYDSSNLLVEYPDLIMETIGDNDSFSGFMDNIQKKYNINTIIISTDPLNHFQYLEWAIRNKINILTDKPLILENDIISSTQSVNNLFSKTKYLVELYKNTRNSGNHFQFDIMAQRRFHRGYRLIWNKIHEIFELTNTPITYINSFNSDGQRRFPDEIINQNYHSYNQGYGKIGHSGYHTIDVVGWLVNSISSQKKNIDNVELFTQTAFPKDIIYQFDLTDYKKFFPGIKFNYHENAYNTILTGFGDVDNTISVSFKHGNKVQTLASINILHNGFSQRNWINTEGRDLYKGNGRIRQEFLMIEQGPFQSIFMESFQSYEKDGDDNNLYVNGGKHHFDIYVYRNTAMFPNLKRVEKFSINDLYGDLGNGDSHGQEARKRGINHFFENIVHKKTNAISNILNHKLSLSLFNNIYKSVNCQFNGLSPFLKFDV